MSRLLFLLMMVVGWVAGQMCEPFAGRPANCLQFYLNTTAIFIPPGVNQSIIAQSLSDNAALLPLIPNPDCKAGLTKLLCGNGLPQCYPNISASPQRLCKSFCEKVVNDCLSIIPAASLPNCSATDPTGAPLYPSDVSLGIVISGSNPMPPCLADLISLNVSQTCYLPFVKTDTGACSLRCPIPIWTDRGYTLSKYLVTYGVLISFICFVIACVILVLIPERMKFPSALSFWLLLTSASSTLMASLGYGFTAPACVNRWTPESQKRGDVFCAFIGAWFIYTTLLSTTWLLALLMTIFCSLYQQLWWMKYRTRVYISIHIFAWIWPLIPTVIGLAYKKMVGGSLGCSVDTSSHHGVWADTLQWGPFGLQTAIGVIMIVLIWWKLVHSVGFRMIFKKHRRLVIFVTYHLWMDSFAVFQRIHSRAMQDAVIKDLTAWAKCSGEASAGARDPSECKQGRTFSTAVAVIGYINLSIVGPIALIVFGLTWDNFYAIDARFRLGLFKHNPLLRTNGNYHQNNDGSSGSTPSTDGGDDHVKSSNTSSSDAITIETVPTNGSLTVSAPHSMEA